MSEDPNRTSSSYEDSLTEYRAGLMTRREAYKALLAVGASAASAVALLRSDSALAQNIEANQRGFEELDSKIEGLKPEPEFQLKVLMELANNQVERRSFLSDPATYTAEKGIVFESDLVRSLTDAVVFGGPEQENVSTSYGLPTDSPLLEYPVRGTYEDFLAQHSPVANAAAVSAAAAVVSAAAAVVSAYTAVSKDASYFDSISQAQRYTLPSGQEWTK